MIRRCGCQLLQVSDFLEVTPRLGQDLSDEFVNLTRAEGKLFKVLHVHAVLFYRQHLRTIRTAAARHCAARGTRRRLHWPPCQTSIERPPPIRQHPPLLLFALFGYAGGVRVRQRPLLQHENLARRARLPHLYVGGPGHPHDRRVQHNARRGPRRGPIVHGIVLASRDVWIFLNSSIDSSPDWVILLESDSWGTYSSRVGFTPMM